MLQDYLPLQPLGNGATGIVFLAQPIRTQQEPIPSLFAIKAFRRSRSHDLHRAHNEEQILSKLLASDKHTPFLPHLHSAFEDGEFRFLVLDYCSGGDLNTLRHSVPDKRFSTAAIRFYAAEIVLALEHLHEQGIVYRDLKPENILLTSDGHIMLTDFDLSVSLPPKKPCAPTTSDIQHDHRDAVHEEEDGDISTTQVTCLGGWPRRGRSHKKKMATTPSRRRIVPASHSSVDDEQGDQGSSSGTSAMEARSHSFVGTEEYVAPEVIRGTGHDFAVDWWGLGVFLYEMAHACTPFSGQTSKQTFDNIVRQEPKIISGTTSAAPLASLISQLLVKDPARRIGSRCGAAEIKAHPFFAGLSWDDVQGVARPPHIPPSEPSIGSATASFDLTSHLVEVECSRAEARAKRRLQRKQAA